VNQNPEPRAEATAVTERLRRASFGALLALLIQYGLGMGVALFVNIPDADKGKGSAAAFGKALSNGPAALAAHTGVGLLLIVNVIVVLVLAIRTRLLPMVVSAVVGLLSVIGAAFSGAQFVDKGTNSSSMTMAVLTGVAIACYAINLYVLGSRRS
jgi:hypothetical protein